MRQHAAERKRPSKGTRIGAVKMIVPVLERALAGSARTAKCWIISRGGEPVAMITPAQKIHALATGDDIVWAFDQDDANEPLGVRYRVIEVPSVRA